ncbi:MAG: hypothetical protein JO148_16640 [Acidimicrobiia bacterium]|nr:hypothetical protein [Acidimicrobiia bacterium]
MVATDACPICRKPILRHEVSVVHARVRGLPESVIAVFHEDCYPGDEGTVFERLNDDDPDGV